jgi:hypothetical protein
MTEEEKGQEIQDPQEAPVEPADVGNQLMRTVAYLAIAAVGAVLVALCVLVLYLMGIF